MLIDFNETHDLGQLINENQKVIIQYGATWCGNCRITKPKFKKLSEEFEDTLFIMVDAEKYVEAREFGIVKNLPVFTTYKNGVRVENIFTSKVNQIEPLVLNIQ